MAQNRQLGTDARIRLGCASDRGSGQVTFKYDPCGRRIEKISPTTMPHSAKEILAMTDEQSMEYTLSGEESSHGLGQAALSMRAAT